MARQGIFFLSTSGISEIYFYLIKLLPCTRTTLGHLIKQLTCCLNLIVNNYTVHQSHPRVDLQDLINLSSIHKPCLLSKAVVSLIPRSNVFTLEFYLENWDFLYEDFVWRWYPSSMCYTVAL